MGSHDLWREVRPGNGTRAAVDPAHYKRLDPEPIAVIERWGLGFCLGNALKYIARAGHKQGVDAAEDLAKARWYVERAARGSETTVDFDTLAVDLEHARAEAERWSIVAREQRRVIEDLQKRLVHAGLTELRDATVATPVRFDVADLDDADIGGEGGIT